MIAFRKRRQRLLWEEYRAKEPEGYGYSPFCELYGAWKDTQDVVLRQEHRAGEKLFVDWAGAKIPIHHREAGELDSASRGRLELHVQIKQTALPAIQMRSVRR
jgi:transposase